MLKPELVQIDDDPRDCRMAGSGLRLRHRRHRRRGETTLRHYGAVSGFLATTRPAADEIGAGPDVNDEHQDAGDVFDDRLLELLVKAQEPAAPDVPKIKGPPAKEAAIDLCGNSRRARVSAKDLGEITACIYAGKRVRGAKGAAWKAWRAGES